MKRTIIWALAVLLCDAGVVFAQQYKWVDQNGHTRYGDIPPPGVKATALKPPPAAPSAPADGSSKDAKKGPATAAEKETEYRKRQQEAQAKLKKEEQANADAATKKQNCDRAQEALRGLESGQRIARFDAKGERYFADDATIEQDKVQARKAVQESCN